MVTFHSRTEASSVWKHLRWEEVSVKNLSLHLENNLSLLSQRLDWARGTASGLWRKSLTVTGSERSWFDIS